MSHPDNELRRTLWELAEAWEYQASISAQSPYAAAKTACARELRQVLTYPAATEADEAALQVVYGKSSEELADEAEGGRA